MKIHIPGVNDLAVKSISKLGDPCPLPNTESEKRRKLSEKKKLLVHAPMSDVGGVMYDKDAVYVNVPGNFTKGNDGGRLLLQAYTFFSVLIMMGSSLWRGRRDGHSIARRGRHS